MYADLLIIHARELVTCASPSGPKTGAALQDAGIISDGAVAVKGDKIIAVGTNDDVLKEVKTTEQTKIIDADGCTVTPGFVDCHTHAVFAGSRENEFLMKLEGKSYLDILKAGGGILSTVKATRAATQDELLEISRKKLDKMLSYGTTTVEIKSGYGLDAETELKMLEVIKSLDESHPIDIAPTFLGAHAFPKEYKGKEDTYVSYLIDKMLPSVVKLSYKFRIPITVDVFCETGVFSLDQTRKIFESAINNGLKVKIHAGEFNDLGGVELAAEHKALSADHLDHLSERAMEAMVKTGTIGVLLPGVNFYLNSEHYAPARRMIEKGVAVALSTDYNPGSCPCLSLPMIMTLACLKYKMTPAETFNSVTINAAHALGLGKRLGSLETGKQADILVFDAPSHAYIPYHFGDNAIKIVLKNGKEVLNRNLT